ncbi:MAG TPA: hypothetical protein VHE30_22230 [Polyangiaceae bacterium]|nr:hypothetical protein [Polyangiaceae bacterium]
MASDGCVILAVGLLGCASNTGTSGETHFLCGNTDECRAHGSNLVCAQGECVDERSIGAGGSGGGTATSLEGVWDVVGSTVGYPSTSMVVTLSPTSLLIDNEGGFLHATRQGELWAVDSSYTIRSRVSDLLGRADRHFPATRTSPVDADLGVIPLPLLGDWTIGNEQDCTGTFGDGSISGGCGPVGPGPEWAPDLDEGSVTATRMETRSSVFGTLGGAWTVTSTKGVACQVTIHDATIMGTCGSASRFAGAFTLQYDQDVVHGSTSNGLEFTAQRR